MEECECRMQTAEDIADKYQAKNMFCYLAKQMELLESLY